MKMTLRVQIDGMTTALSTYTRTLTIEGLPRHPSTRESPQPLAETIQIISLYMG